MTLDQASDIAQVVVGCASVLIASLALSTSQRISNQQSKIAINSTRAYLIPEHAKISVFESGRAIEVEVGIKNWGQTPALRTRATARTYLATSKQNPNTVAPLVIGSNKGEVALAPQGMLILGQLGKDDPPLTERQFDQIKEGKLVFFCDFLTEYYHLANEKHESFVRYFLESRNISPGAMPPLSHGKGDLTLS